MSETSLYFIALIPPKNVFETIHTIKLYVSEKYHCKQALKSPPHITLEPPFSFPLKKEEYLIKKVKQINSQLNLSNITIELSDYDIFLPRVIFINVRNTDALTHLYNTVHYFVKTELNIVKDLPPRLFHPHITVAFRDVKKQQVPLIVQDLKNNYPIQESFTIQLISLLKHNGKEWDIIL
ncbi:MAG: 2'-5' RNA ligase family protein [Bacteroidia bacterium]|nr:2'-5' RNA ligase family protein [Bacteroidia bacterium]